MLLRKHLQNGRITDISQPGLERIVHIQVEHLDEMGDLCHKKLVIEIMGKHSNIIFCSEDNVIIDSIKRVSAAVSSLREVLPGKPYYIAQTQEKLDALACTYQDFQQVLSSRPQPAFKALYGSFTGISPVLAQELCHEAGIDGERPTAALEEADYKRFYQAFSHMVERIQKEQFCPNIAYQGKKPVEFAAIPLTLYGPSLPGGREDAFSQTAMEQTNGDLKEMPHGNASYTVPFPSMSTLLESYYAEKNTLTRIRQKSSDLRHIVQTALERTIKKYDLQMRQIEDTQKRDTYRIYGELLNTYGYSAAPGARSLEALNYYTGELVILVIVLAHIDVESVTADIMKGLAGDFLLFGAALFADVAASHQFFFDLYQVLLMEGNVQGRGDGLQMVNLLFHLPCQFRQDFVGALQLPVSVKIFFGIFRGT